MMGCIGVELDGEALRAVRLEGRRGQPPRVLETGWDREMPADAVRAIGESLGRARRVAIAIRLPLLFTKRVALPPLPLTERRRMLQLEPQRYFPVRLEDLTVAVRSDDLVFAAREAPLSEWVRALETLGPVDLVEAGPVALARALAFGGIRDALVALDDRARGLGVIEIRGGDITAVRRLHDLDGLSAFANAQDAAGRKVYLSPYQSERAAQIEALLQGIAPAPLPDVAAVSAPFLSAYGAALGVGSQLDGALVPDELRSRIVGRRRRELATACVAALAGAAFALGSVDAWRARGADHLAAELHTLKSKAAPALAVQSELAALERQTQAITGIEQGRPDALYALLVVSRRLPPGAHIRSLRLAGTEWQMDGFARRAAEVTQALGKAPELSGIRALAATNRAQAGDGFNETFSLAFQLARRP